MVRPFLSSSVAEKETEAEKLGDGRSRALGADQHICDSVAFLSRDCMLCYLTLPLYLGSANLTVMFNMYM